MNHFKYFFSFEHGLFVVFYLLFTLILNFILMSIMFLQFWIISHRVIILVSLITFNWVQFNTKFSFASLSLLFALFTLSLVIYGVSFQQMINILIRNISKKVFFLRNFIGVVLGGGKSFRHGFKND